MQDCGAEARRSMRIIIAVDDSPYSECAVREVATRPWPEGSVVRVISAVPGVAPSAAELWFDAGGSMETVSVLRREGAQELAERSVALLHAAGLAAELRVLAGELQRIVVTEAKTWPADLVVVAFHGKAGGRQWPLGSVTLAIVKHAPCSVEVFRAKS
jgi:nucleotide-binding universal stress UspA family protein